MYILTNKLVTSPKFFTSLEYPLNSESYREILKSIAILWFRPNLVYQLKWDGR